MLNLLVHYRRPTRASRVSGIPTDRRRSGYNGRARSLPLLRRRLLEDVDAPFLLVSFNNEGFISPAEMRAADWPRLGGISGDALQCVSGKPKLHRAVHPRDRAVVSGRTEIEKRYENRSFAFGAPAGIGEDFR
jgi:hypothetical protein